MNTLRECTDLERVAFALKWINSRETTKLMVKRADKNRVQSETIRKEGNKLYKKQKFEDALKLYTKCLSMAAMESVELQLAFGNRSATFFQLEMYEECLADIDQVTTKRCSRTLLDKLLKRKRATLQLLPTQIKTPYYADLPTIPDEEQNPKIPSASNAIAINQNAQFGRHIVAQRDIKIGEVLIVEKPLGQLVVREMESHCSECMELCYNLIPCDYCSLALYCNESCKKTAFERYHQFECPIGESLRQFGDEVVLAVRIAFATRDEWNHADLNAYETATSKRFQSDRYKELHSLERNESHLALQSIFENSVMAASVFWMVQRGTKFFKKYDVRKFKRVIMRLIGIMPCNIVTQHELGFQVEKNRFIKRAFAACIYPVCALVNHSCVANLTSYSCGNQQIVCSVLNIKKGEQCFINYEHVFGIRGFDRNLINKCAFRIGYEDLPKKERNELLFASFSFTCTCKACEDDWPLMKDLPELEIPFCNDHATQLTMVDRDPKVMRELKGKLISFLEEYGDRMPSINVFLAKGELAFCFNGLGNIKRPLQN